MQTILFILNDAPYGNERSYNALRLATSLAATEGNKVRIFLFGDAVSCAKSGQKVPSGFYNMQLMISKILHQGSVAACGSCLEARGFSDSELIDGVMHGSLSQLTQWTNEAEKVLVF